MKSTKTAYLKQKFQKSKISMTFQPTLSNNTRYPILTIAIFLLFAIVYGLVSIVNHYNFRTYGLDYGLFNHAVYQFSHLESNRCHLCFITENYFGDHFSPIVFILIPFQVLLGSYGLIIAQIIAVLLGGLGFYKYALLRANKDYLLSQIMLISFLSFVGIFSALSFDFHTNVLAAMFIPWIFYFLEKKNFLGVIIIWLLILFSKENMGFWMAFFFLGLLFVQKGKYRKSYKYSLLALAVLSILYFLVIVMYVMPALQNAHTYKGLIRYDAVGNSFREIAWNCISRPFYVLNVMITDTFEGYSFKKEFLWVSLLSGAWACILRPAYFFMLLPLIAQKLMSNKVHLWGIHYHYYVEFGPIFIIALLEVLIGLKMKRGLTLTLAVVSAILCVLITLIKTNFQENYYVIQQARFLRKEHYMTEWNNKAIHKAIQRIPSEVTISCSNQLAPRLYQREKIYLFPKVLDAQFIVLMKKANHYPLRQEQFDLAISELKINEEFTLTFENEEVYIFEKLEQ